MNEKEQFENVDLLAKKVPVNFILQIIKDDYYYQAFINNFEKHRKIFGTTPKNVYAKSIKDFKETVNQNDFDLSDEHYQRINYIIDNHYKPENSLADIVNLNKYYIININKDKCITLSSLFSFISDEKRLANIFNATDKNASFNKLYTGLDLINAFALFLKILEENWEQLNIDDNDPILYKLISIVNAFSHVIEEQNLKFLMPEEGIAETSKYLDDTFLSILLSSKTVPLETKKFYLRNVSESKLKMIYEKMELKERSKIAKELGIWEVAPDLQQKIDLINDYIENNLINNLKKVFNGYVSEEKYNDLLNSVLLYNKKGFISRFAKDRYLGISDENNIIIDIETACLFSKNYPIEILIDVITHEAVHHISKSIYGEGFEINGKYSGINEAVTQYLTEQCLGEKSYVKIAGHSHCYYSKTVILIDKLVKMGIFTIDELAYNYVNNNVEYLQKTLTKYVDDDTYNKMIDYFYQMNNSTNYQQRKTAEDKLEQIIIELREKVKSKESQKKRN